MTIALRLGELTVDALIEKLKNGLEPRIAAINAEKADDVTLVAPRKHGGPSRDGSDYYRGGATQQVEGTTAVIVAEGLGEFEEEGPHSFQFRPRLLVRVYTEDPNREALTIRLQRLVRAVIECVYDDDPKEALLVPGGTLTPLAYRIFPEASRPGPAFEPDEPSDPWRSYSDVIFIAVQSEGD